MSTSTDEMWKRDEAHIREAMARQASSELATSKPAGPVSSLSCDALVLILRDAEFEYRGAILEYNKAEEEGVSSFHEHNTASYKKGIRDAYRNLLQQNVPDEPRAGVALSDHLSHEKPN